MTEPRNMSEPVTRQELHDSLEIWGGQLRAELRDEIATQGAQLRAEFRAEFAEVRADFARWATTILETLRAEIRAVFEPHDDVPERVTKLEELPARVERLEARVFAPKRETKRARPAKRTSRRR